ncbi:MAG: ComF family protein [Candidatus Giovannonibacteria bacterium]|nr:ComF family protein [Candidatus Giovannonibacteria bacterium]
MKTGWKNNIHMLGARVLNLILPRYCAGCRKSGESFCENCLALSYKYGANCLICGQRNNSGSFCKNCRPQGSALKSALWAGRYGGALREAVRQLKYKKRKELAEPLANLLYKKFNEIYLEIKLEDCAIIPVPLHFKKEHERGFNQAELLAREFSKLSDIQLLTGSLLKIKETLAQVEVKDKEKRIKNLEGAFSVAENALSFTKHKTIILIDDVSTTGATLIHAAHALEKAGAEKIIGLAVAHG